MYSPEPGLAGKMITHNWEDDYTQLSVVSELISSIEQQDGDVYLDALCQLHFIM